MQDKMTRNKIWFNQFKIQLEWYSFIIITILTLIVLVYYPTLTTIEYSFYDVSVMGYNEEFVGLHNYTFLLSNRTFLRAMANTVILAALGLLTIPIGFILASLINSIARKKLQSFFRVGFYLPNIITGVTIVMIFQIILKGYDGLLNTVLSSLTGLDIQTGWLTDPRFAKIGATIIWIFSNQGYAMLICLASIQSIPHEIYEVASVDGASAYKQWLHLTIPNMKACFSFLFVTGMISGLSRFTDLYIVSGYSGMGGSNNTLQTILLYIYQYSFEQPRYGLSSAGAIILFVFVLLFTLLNVKLSGMMKEE